MIDTKKDLNASFNKFNPVEEGDHNKDACFTKSDESLSNNGLRLTQKEKALLVPIRRYVCLVESDEMTEKVGAPQIERREQYNEKDGSIYIGDMKLSIDHDGNEIWI